MTEAPLLVFGDDGSPGSDVAWLWINTQHWPGWRIEVVTATEPEFPPADWGQGAAPHEWTPPRTRDVFDQAEMGETRFLAAAADPRVLLGDRTDANLIVTGPRGLGHLKALWVGSTTEWLLHHPPAPLAVIRHGARVERAAVCVDGSAHAEAALAAFVRLPLAQRAEVTVVAVDDGRVDVDAAVERALADLASGGVQAADVTLSGKPTKAILEYLAEHAPQMAVFGTRGLTGIARLRLGSTASAIVRATECSSLVACAD